MPNNKNEARSLLWSLCITRPTRIGTGREARVRGAARAFGLITAHAVTKEKGRNKAGPSSHIVPCPNRPFWGIFKMFASMLKKLYGFSSSNYYIMIIINLMTIV